MPSRSPKSKGEADLGLYLEQRGFSYEYEPQVGRHNPDFVIESASGRVVLEVIEPEDQLPAGGGAFDPHPPIRKAVKRKIEQGSGAAALALPYVLVIGTSRTTYPYDEVTVPGALFGNTTIVFPVGPGAPPDPNITVEFGAGGRLQQQRNTRFSAVALIRGFNPTAHHIEAAFAEEAKAHAATRDAVAAGLRRAEELTAEGLFDPDAHSVRLDVFHNHHAARPIGLDLFDGPGDRQWGADDAGLYRCLLGDDR